MNEHPWGAVAPLPHNDRLVSAVHPRDWQNPTPRERYHLVVIGAGTAGLVTAAGAAGLGARVALIERHLMGGDCLNVGCVPSKGVIAPARAWSAARRASEQFGGPHAAGAGDFAAAMDRMRRLRAQIAPVDGAERFRGLGVDVYFGEARFVSPQAVHVGDATLEFRRAVIATGARAKAPPIPGLADVPYLTNETLFDLDTCPEHLVVLGGGPIGCEMAQAFARLGARVTLLDKAPRLLPRDDPRASTIVRDALARDGVRVVTSADLQRVRRDGASGIAVECTVNGAAETVTGSTLLVAIGRAPNVEGIGLEAAGVAFTPQGVTVNDRLQTTNPTVFACGDVASRYQFTHAADFQARIVIQNALFFGRKRASDLVIPWATYTSPEVAQVGHTAESAAAAGLAIQSFTVPMHDVDRAILDDDTEGFATVHVAAGTDRIVGVTVVAAHASELIHEATLAMTHRLGLAAISASIHPYPTQGDALRRCADAWRRTKLTPTVRQLFTQWFRWFS
ncbi:MAG: mercuric reductase [Gemmatimonadaceae bacterium]|nr:mercuric reductase [Gemmatimonadaceae bacterium]